MRGSLLKNTVKTSCGLFCLLLIVHGFEAIVLRMDETFFGENFINKLFGILVLYLSLRLLGWRWRDIGFSCAGLPRNLVLGFSLGAAVFALAYAAECLILKGQGLIPQFGLFTTGFSLAGAPEVHRGAGFLLMCVIFNIINVLRSDCIKVKTSSSPSY